MNDGRGMMADVLELSGVIRISVSLQFFPRVCGDIFYQPRSILKHYCLEDLTRNAPSLMLFEIGETQKVSAWRRDTLWVWGYTRRVLNDSIPPFILSKFQRALAQLRSRECLSRWIGCVKRVTQSRNTCDQKIEKSSTMPSTISWFEFLCVLVKNSSSFNTAALTGTKKRTAKPLRGPPTLDGSTSKVHTWGFH